MARQMPFMSGLPFAKRGIVPRCACTTVGTLSNATSVSRRVVAAKAANRSRITTRLTPFGVGGRGEKSRTYDAVRPDAMQIYAMRRDTMRLHAMPIDAMLIDAMRFHTVLRCLMLLSRAVRRRLATDDLDQVPHRKVHVDEMKSPLGLRGRARSYVARNVVSARVGGIGVYGDRET